MGLEQQTDPISEQIRLRQEAQINSLLQGIRDRGLSMVRNSDGHPHHRGRGGNSWASPITPELGEAQGHRAFPTY